MTLFTHSLWSDTVANPYRKMGIAMIAAPFAVLVLLSLGAFLIAGMTQPTQADAVASTLEVVPMLAASVFGFFRFKIHRNFDAISLDEQPHHALIGWTDLHVGFDVAFAVDTHVRLLDDRFVC